MFFSLAFFFVVVVVSNSYLEILLKLCTEMRQESCRSAASWEARAPPLPPRSVVFSLDTRPLILIK